MSTDPFMEGFNSEMSAAGKAPARNHYEDADDWDVTLVEHRECAAFMRSVGINAFALEEDWQEHIVAGTRVLLVDKCFRVAGDLRERYQAGELLTVRTPLPYRFPSEFLTERMAVSGITTQQPDEVRELWRICTHANSYTHIADEVEATKHPGMLPKPKLPKVSSYNEVMAAESPEWLIDSLVAKDSLTMLASASTSGKSLLVIDWCMRMLHGMSWHGRAVRPGSTLYLCGEGASGIGGRLRGWKAANPSERPQGDRYLLFSHSIPTLSTPAGCDALRMMIENLQRDRGHAPNLVVVDTLSQAFGEGDENDSKTVAPALKALADLRQKFHFAILILHHLTKASPALSLNSVRGSGAFTANVDIVLGISVQDDLRTLRTLKLKDGEMAPPLPFEIVGIETGRTLPDGNAERAPIIVPAKETPAKSQPHEVDHLIYNAIRMAGREGLSRSQIEDYAGVSATQVFESVFRMDLERTIVKRGASNPRYYLPANAPEERG
jgi:hypothetical protein